MHKLILALLILGACSHQKAAKPDSDEFQKGKKLAELSDKKLDEASGLAASISNPDLLWTHNDSGNESEVYLVDKNLNVKLTCKLKGIENRDWEDITIGPGPDDSKNYIYVGDIGDNMARFEYKHIYRFEEPEFDSLKREIVITDFDTITVQFMDGKKDSEALMIDPNTKHLYLISKREEPVMVYEIEYPYSTTETIQVSPMMSLPLTQIVAADFSADGDEIIMKNYQNVFYWKVNKGESWKETLKHQPLILKYDEEPQGEAITFARDASGYYTISEKISGEKSHLLFYKRK